MLIDFSQWDIEIRPHEAPTTLVFRCLETEVWAAQLGSDDVEPPINRAEVNLLKPDARVDLSREVFPVASFVEWKIRRFGVYTLESTILRRDTKETAYRACNIWLRESGELEIEADIQAEGQYNLKIYLHDFNPNSAEPVPLADHGSSGPRLTVWERLDS